MRKPLFCFLCLLVFNAEAALLERLGGLAYYDDEADLTWLADAYAANGSLNWNKADAWVTSLDVAGVTGWRMPTTITPDPSCSVNGGAAVGFGCTGGEMGNLYYNVLGNTAGAITNTGPFSNVIISPLIVNAYWTSTFEGTNAAWHFDMGTGEQDHTRRDVPRFTWAVHDGDVEVIPVPAAVWLFSSGLIGLIGLARRKAH